MKKLMTLVAIIGCGFVAFAGPPPSNCGGGGCRPGGGGGCRPCPPPPPHHGHHDCKGSSGVRLAADIVGLVGNSIGVVNALTPRTTVVVPAQPAVVQPAVVQPVVAQPVVQQPVVAQPVVQQPVAQQQTPAVNQTIIIQQPATSKTDGRENGYNPHGYNL